MIKSIRNRSRLRKLMTRKLVTTAEDKFAVPSFPCKHPCVMAGALHGEVAAAPTG